MINRDELFSFIDETIGIDLLAHAQVVDSRANGVQVMGKSKIAKVAIGVSVNLSFLQEAVKRHADVCLFHHGLHFADIYNSRLDPALQSQLQVIFDNHLTIAGFHFSLDHHPEIGNNAQIIAKLGAKRLEIGYFDDWGWVAEFDQPMVVGELVEKCRQLFDRDIFTVLGGKQTIKRIGVVSGGGKPTGKWLHEIFDKQIDAHLTGEIAEGGPALAKDGGFNYFACGHYATEKFGIEALGAKIQNHFGKDLSVEFIDIPNTL